MRTEPVHPIRNVRHLRPQEEWKEMIALYLYLAGMGAGSFMIGMLIHWLGVTLNPTVIPSIHLFGNRLISQRFRFLGTNHGRYRRSSPYFGPRHQAEVHVCLSEPENILGGQGISHPLCLHCFRTDSSGKVCLTF